MGSPPQGDHLFRVRHGSEAVRQQTVLSVSNVFSSTARNGAVASGRISNRVSGPNAAVRFPVLAFVFMIQVSDHTGKQKTRD